MHRNGGYCDRFVQLRMVTVVTWAEAAKTTCTSEILGRETRLRQWYASTGLNDERVCTVVIAALGFWCALYRLGMSGSALCLVIKVKDIICLSNVEKAIRNILNRLVLIPEWCKNVFIVLGTSIFMSSYIAQYVSCSSVAFPSTHSDHCALFPRQGHVITENSSDIFQNHLRYSTILNSVPPDHTMKRLSKVLHIHRTLPSQKYFEIFPLWTLVLQQDSYCKPRFTSGLFLHQSLLPANFSNHRYQPLP